MMEWNTTDDKGLLPPESPDPAPRVAINYRVLPGFVVLLVGVGIAIALLWWWRAREVEAQISSDLLLLIRREEQARRFGLEDQIPQFAAEGVPAPWLARYEDSFSPGASPAISVTVSIVGIEVEGEDAIVQVQMGRQVQERRYRQTSQGWRRVPVADYDPADATSRRTGSTTFRYHLPDTEIAADIIEQYPAMLEIWSAWGGTLPELSTVEIHNTEFVRPAYVVETTLYVAKPSVIAMPAHWDLTADEGVRYWLAREIGTRVTLGRSAPGFLPGRDRFINALITVTALRWAAVGEVYPRLTAMWHTVAATQHGSSFYAMPHHTRQIDPFAPTPQEAAALLMADLLYTGGGHERIARLVQAMSGAPRWDTVFETVTGYTTLDFETLARGGPIPSTILDAASVRGVPVPNDSQGPYQAFQLQIKGYEQPIWVQMTETTRLFLSDETELAPGCVTAFDEVVIEGAWYESGLRLGAERITGTPTDITDQIDAIPAPSDTVYFTTVYQPDPAGIAMNQLVAVNESGNRIPVWSRPTINFYAALRQVAPTGHASQGIPAVGPVLRNCPLQRVMRYLPESGRVDTWLFRGYDPIGTPFYLWDEQRGVGLVATPNFSGGAGGYKYWLLGAGGESVRAGDEKRLPVGEPRLLRPGKDEVLVHQVREQRLLLYGISTEREQWTVTLEPNAYPVSVVFDVTGRYLYVTTGEPEESPDDAIPERSVVTRYDLITDSHDVLWSASLGGVGSLVVDNLSPRLYAIVERIEDDHATLMLFEDDAWAPIAAAAPREALYGLLPCRNGGALYSSSDIPPLEAQAPFKTNLYRIDPTGRRLPGMLAMEPGETILAC